MRILSALLVLLVASSRLRASAAAQSRATCRQCRRHQGDRREVAAALDKLRPLLTDAQRAALERPLTTTPPSTGRTCRSASCRAPACASAISMRSRPPPRARFAAALSACGLKLLDEIRARRRLPDPVRQAPDRLGRRQLLPRACSAPRPRKTPWMLQIGGHHLAYNFTFNGRAAGATPLFFGSEPIRFDDRASITSRWTRKARPCRIWPPHRHASRGETLGHVHRCGERRGRPGDPGQLPNGGTDTRISADLSQRRLPIAAS